LNAFFLEKTKGDTNLIYRIIDENCRKPGWLIFATHDVKSNPSEFGCTPKFFEAVVRYASNAGAAILPVAQAYSII
jgi:hypothetical protein